MEIYILRRFSGKRLYLLGRSQGWRIYLLMLVCRSHGQRIYMVSRSQGWGIYLKAGGYLPYDACVQVSRLLDIPGKQV